MKDVKSISKQILGTPSKILQTYICEGCGYEVKEMELLMPIGPQKGQWVKTIANCTCATLEIEKQVEKELEEVRRRKIFTINSIVSDELKQATFDSFQPENQTQTAALKKSREYVLEFSLQKPRNLIFRGPYGVGKSHLSYSILKEVFKKGYMKGDRAVGFSCIFINVPKLLSRIRASYKEQSRYAESDLIAEMTKVDLLVLDEIGRGYDPNGWAEEKLFEIIDQRAGKNTIYTTNYGADELAQKIGGHNVSRMLQNATALVIEGRDRRVPA